MNLYDPWPNEVTVNQHTYRLDLSFDNVLYALKARGDEGMTMMDRCETFLQLVIKQDMPPVADWVDVHNAIIDLITTAKQRPMRYDINGDPIEPKGDGEHIKADYDFDFDASYIYAAFRQTYGIDLVKEQGQLHWLSFVALFDALPDDTAFVRIRHIRSTRLGDIKDKKQRDAVRRQQRALALPDDENEEEGGDSYGS